MPKITINNIEYDPELALSAASAAALQPRSVADTNYLMVQTAAALSEAEKRQLEQAGAKILEYVPDSTYLCHYPPQTLTPIRALPFVTWAGPYLKGFKIDPALTSRDTPHAVANVVTMSMPAAHPSSPMGVEEVEVVFHQNVVPRQEVPKLVQAAAVQIGEEQIGTNKIRLQASTKAIQVIAGLDTVRHIEKVLPADLLNDQARGILRIPSSNPRPVLTGAGQIVAVADTGFDNGRTDATIHPAFIGRVRKLEALGRTATPASPALADDPHGHGTHVAGSVLGDAFSAALGVRIQGTAPGASLVLQSCYRNSAAQLGGIPAVLDQLFSPPYNQDGARIHSNSWGSRGSAGVYNQRAHEVDDFVFKHRDCLILFAAGNDGVDSVPPVGEIDLGSVTAPGTAKNCLTVGASENLRPNALHPAATWNDSRWPHAPIIGDLQADNPEGMAPFSGRGPTRQKRVKPDVVAPGTFVLSARSRSILTQFTPTWPSADPEYFFQNGTSMATPLVAGCAALVREWLARDHATTTPSAALVKALLINGASDMAGQYVPSEAPAIPNYSEGFGRVDVAQTIDHASARAKVFLWLDEKTALAAGATETQTVNLPQGVDVLKATLVWTDPAGAGLQNDLDLIVRDGGGNECHGNKPLNDPQFDQTNNVEQVLWVKPAVGLITVSVRATRITVHPQSYALIIRVK